MQVRYLLLLAGLVAGLSGRDALAQATAPDKGGEVNAIRVTATTMELSFGTSGTGEGRVVTIAATAGGMPVPLVATDGQFYTAAPTYGQGASLGQGYVVYNGTGHSTTVTGLQPGTYYYITNAEYNAEGPSIAYNTRGTSMSTATSSAAVVAPAPLPVELTAFSGTVDAYSAATLHWRTASERNAAYFALERSADGVNFIEVGRVAATSPSRQPLAYQWPDPQRLVHATYYRLRQVDLDGTAQYSGVVTLTSAAQLARHLEVYPNPSAGQPLNLVLQGYSSEPLTLRLTDALGRPVFTQAFTPTDAYHLAPLPLPQGLAAGTYVLTLAGSGNPIQKRIVVSY